MSVRPLHAALTFLALLGIAGIVALACGGGAPPTPTQRCCESAMGKTVRDACLAGEIGYPIERCNGTPDAGTDGGTAPVCGDGTKDPSEQCEHNADCTGAGVVCRKCSCAFSADPVEYPDPNDLPAAEAGAFDIAKLTLVLSANPKDTVKVDAIPGTGQNPDPPIAICVVFLESSAEVARLCAEVTTTSRKPTYKDNTGKRDLMQPEAQLLSGVGGGPVFTVNPSLLHVRPSVSFHVESLRDGRVVDRLPDTGEISYTDILGN